MEERNAKVYSDEQLASELKNKRAAGGGAKALSIAGVILVVAGLMTTLISVAIFGVILCLIGALVMNSHEKSMKQQIGDQLVRGLLESVFEEVDYQPTGHISGSVMDAAVLPVEFHTVEGSHDVKAVNKGMHIELSGVTLIQENDYYNDDAGMWETVKGEAFKGQWLVCEFGYELSTELRVGARTGIKRLFSGSVVKTDNEEFNKKFIIQPEEEECPGYSDTAYCGLYSGNVVRIWWENLYEFSEKRTAAHCNTDGAAIFYIEQRKNRSGGIASEVSE